MRSHLTLQAIEDLDNIRAYLLPRSASGAEHVRLSIELTIDLLTIFPGIARDTDIKDVRVIPVMGYPYLVYHRLTRSEVVVVHIRHSSRENPSPHALKRE